MKYARPLRCTSRSCTSSSHVFHPAGSLELRRKAVVFRSICIFHVCSAVSSTHAFHPFDSRPFIMCLMTRRPPVTFSQFSNQLFHALAIRSLFKRRKPWRAISNAGLLFSASSTWRFTRTARILLTCPELAASALRIEPVRLGGAGAGVGVTAGSTASHVLVGLSCFTSFLSSPLAARRFQPFLSGVRPVFGLKVAPSSSASARLRSASAAIASRFALMSDDWRKSRSCGAAAAASVAPPAAASPSAPRVAIASLARPSDASAKRTDRFGNRRCCAAFPFRCWPADFARAPGHCPAAQTRSSLVKLACIAAA